MSDYPIYLNSLEITPRHRELVVRVYRARPQMKKAPAGGTSHQVWPYHGARRIEEWPST
ncbi:hypothetical protein MaMV-DH010068 [Cyanophage MaMV-DH01]|nr:hypothetical protein MaMV-DH010068 [Cyanophage MaMV-DH01]